MRNGISGWGPKLPSLERPSGIPPARMLSRALLIATKCLLANNLSRLSWVDFVVPFTMEGIALDVDLGEFVVGDFDSGGIAIGVQF